MILDYDDGRFVCRSAYVAAGRYGEDVLRSDYGPWMWAAYPVAALGHSTGYVRGRNRPAAMKLYGIRFRATLAASVFLTPAPAATVCLFHGSHAYVF